jgi:hypothetical protein
MLIKYYSLQEHRTLNHDQLCDFCDDCIKVKYKNWIFYNTTSFEKFESITPKTLHELFEEQEKAAKQEADIFLKYSYLSQHAYEKTLDQYHHFYFLDWHAYLKTQLREFVIDSNKLSNTYLQPPTQPQPQPPPQPSLYTQSNSDSPNSCSITTQATNIADDNLKANSDDLNANSIQDTKQDTKTYADNTVFVSREAIRNITGYTSRPIPEWDKDKKPVFIEWQEQLLNDESEYIVVDWSRQLWKSYIIAEKLIEESFIPNNDSLVGAFISKTTDVIRNYVLKLTRKFPKWTFEEFRKDGYIINLHTLTKIYFRTLWDEAAWVRWLTLKRVIVDEAQLVEDSVYEEVLEPTMATTWWQLILIGTAWKKRAGYMFALIADLKKGKYESWKYYKISADENPLLHPSKRKWINANRDKPSVRREYFNEWWDIGDNLFHIKRAKEFPLFDIENNFFVLGIDPARLNDRSGYSLLHVWATKITIIQSWFVPDSHKSKWELQRKFYSSLIEWYQKKHREYRPNHKHPSNKWYNVMDVSWVGDWVAVIFREEVKLSWFVRYTSGLTDSSLDGMNFRVSKTVLINNFLDLCQEWVIEVFEPANAFLIEEMSYIEEWESRAWHTAMKSDFYDDITNATMIAAYFAVKRKLLWRIQSSDTLNDSAYIKNPVVDWIELRKKRTVSRNW